jgi:hypothetical protein
MSHSKSRPPRSTINRPYYHEIKEVPNQFCDYIASCEGNRFEEICKIYLKGLSMDDVKYLKPEDLIDIVPPEQHRHKLLMTVLVRRYIFNKNYNDIDNDINDSDNDINSYSSCMNRCSKCNHICYNYKCTHTC